MELRPGRGQTAVEESPPQLATTEVLGPHLYLEVFFLCYLTLAYQYTAGTAECNKQLLRATAGKRRPRDGMDANVSPCNDLATCRRGLRRQAQSRGYGMSRSKRGLLQHSFTEEAKHEKKSITFCTYTSRRVSQLESANPAARITSYLACNRREHQSVRAPNAT